jgi:hypothetical protein
MKTFKKPDLNAPRFRNKRKSVLTVDTLKKFKEKYPQYKDLDYPQFKKIIMTFNQTIVDGIIDSRGGVELPDGLGYIFIGSCPAAKKKNIDFKKSTEFGVEATHRNWDSDNKLMKIFYTNRNTKYPFRNKQVWAFKASKPFRKAASAVYKEEWTKYIEVAPTEKISARFDRNRKKARKKDLKPYIPEGYDEFNMS